MLGHIWLSGAGEKYIYSFHMPLFFLLAGYVHSNNQQGIIAYVHRKLRTLILPYFSFSLFSYGYWLLIQRNFIPSPIDPVIAFRNIFLSQGADEYLPHNPVLWFLTCLFVIQIFFYVLVQLKSSYLIAASLGLSSFVGYYLSTHVSSTWPWSIDVAFTGVVFYGIGYLLKQTHWLEAKRLNHKLLLILAFFLLLPFWLYTASQNRFISLAYNVIGNYAPFYLAALSGTFLVLLLAQLLSEVKILHYLGRNSLIILGFHFPIKYGVVALTSYLSHVPIDTIKQSFLISSVDTLITLLLLVPIIYGLNTKFSFLLGRRKSLPKVKEF